MKPKEIWHDATPDATVELSSVAPENIVTEDVIFTVAEEAIGGGVLEFYAMFYPLGPESNLVAA
jgi:hypothetical protein